MMKTASFVALLAAALLWPAIFNGYPLIFGDSGVYLLDGASLHVSWARPFFYGLAMLPLHLKQTAWPVVIAQAALAASVIQLTLTSFVPFARVRFRLVVLVVLSAATSLPWFASQLMPDVFGALIVLLCACLMLRPERLSPAFQLLLVLTSAMLATFHQSFIPVLGVINLVLLCYRWRLARRPRGPDVARAFTAPAIAIALVVAANTVFLGHASFSPYGSIFPLARSILEGPGLRTLERECPQPNWTLCEQVGHFPDNFEDFLFGEDGTVNRAGGYAVVGAQAGPILSHTLKAEPGAMLAASSTRMVEQFFAIASGDWLLKPKPAVLDAWKAVFPPAEVARFTAARQQRFLPLVGDDLQLLHRATGYLSLAILVVACALEWRRRSLLSGLLGAVLVALIVNAAVTGGLSGVYDRYQSRFVWLAVLGTLMWITSVRQSSRPAGDDASA